LGRRRRARRTNQLSFIGLGPTVGRRIRVRVCGLEIAERGEPSPGGGGDRRDFGGGLVGDGGRGFWVFWKVRGGGGATSGTVNDFERGLGLRLLSECDREMGSDSVVYLRLVLHLRFFFF